jgi:hypothetical protein
MGIYQIEDDVLVIDGQPFKTLPAQKEELISVLCNIENTINQVIFDFNSKISPSRKIGWFVNPVGEEKFQLISNKGEIVLEWPSSESGKELAMKLKSILVKASHWELP